ncbi:hypothetical protein AOLI_G00331120 [Acnodon oligacanthus]
MLRSVPWASPCSSNAPERRLPAAGLELAECLRSVCVFRLENCRLGTLRLSIFLLVSNWREQRSIALKPLSAASVCRDVEHFGGSNLDFQPTLSDSGYLLALREKLFQMEVLLLPPNKQHTCFTTSLRCGALFNIKYSF